MTPDERTLLSNFLQDLSQARTGPKDAEAEGMIKQAVAANPDAAYLLVQHTILSDQALQAAQQRIADLEAQLSPQQSGGFFGGARQSPWSSPGQTSVPPTQQPYAPQPAPSPFSGGGGLGGFLRQAGTMAAGVAAGDMLFEGLSGLFGGHRGYGGGFGGFGGGWGGGPSVENVTINEYNDTDTYDSGYDNSGGGGDDWSNDS